MHTDDIKWIQDLLFMGNHNHSDGSNFRLKDSIIKVEKLINTAIEKGHVGVSLTDHETVSLHIRIMKYVQQLKKDKKKLNGLIEKHGNENIIELAKKEGIDYDLISKMAEDFTLGLGNEIYLVDSLEEVKDNYQSGITKFPHFLLIAKNIVGHEQIRELSSEAWSNSFYTGQMERVATTKDKLHEIINKNKGHIIASTACVGGEFMTGILELLQATNENEALNAKVKIHSFVTYCLDLFGDDFYIEIQPTIDEVINKMNLKAIEIANAYKIKTIITTDSHYPTKEMSGVHESYLNSKDGDREVASFYSTTYIMSVEEMWSYFKDCVSQDEFIKCINNTLEIKNKIQDYTLEHEVIIPEIAIKAAKLQHIFEEWYHKYKYINNFAKSEYIQDKYFLQLIEEGFIDKQQEFNEENINRINMELKELWLISLKLKQRMSSYYNLVEYIVDLMWDDERGNSFVGVARGSVTGFYTCFLIGITQMNPIKWKLPHWRHLVSERPELPDVDLDSEACKRQNIFTSCKKDFGYNNVLNITTFKTEGSKSSVLTACRGMGINSDDAQFIADMIPFERGSSWSLSDCFFGNEKENRKPLKEFINVVGEYEGLKEVMLAIEGLIVGRSIHASGVYIFKNGYLKQNALMKAPNGDVTTQWNMTDSDWAGGLKIDFLTIEAEDKLRICCELLLKHEKIEWQGKWRDTYNKYIHPEVLNYDNKEMWEKVGKNEIDSLFQFVTPIGLATAKELKPYTLPQLADSNSLMRLMAQEDATETPVETYSKYKNDISLWYKEVREWGITEEEIKVLEQHLIPVNGVASTQEDLMEMSMNPKISNFDVILANKLRKSIAKKNKKAQEEIKTLFFENGLKVGTSEKLLSYVWDVQILRQIGYSFSRNHTYPYSNIAIQEMNLAHFYNPIFWNCACLTVDSGAVEDFSNFDDEEGKDKSTNYGKMAQAIGKMRSRGVKIALPHINEANFEFTPNEDSDEIVFGLKGLVGIGDSTVHEIMNNRPYTSLEDFHNRLVEVKKEVVLSTGKIQNKSLVSLGATFSLIKAGAFDKVENMPRERIIQKYIRSNFPHKESLDMRTVEKIVDLGIIPESLNLAVRINNFKNYVVTNPNFVKQDKEKKTKKWYRLAGENTTLTKYVEDFFEKHFILDMKENEDYYYDDNGDTIFACKLKSTGFEKVFDKNTKALKEWLNSSDCLERYNKYLFEGNWNKYANGNISKWEMDSLSFYYHEHELANVNKEKYSIKDFEYMSEEPIVEGFSFYKGREYPKFKLNRIAGTVLDKNKAKHTVSLLTVSGEVVLLKFYSGQFGFYDKQISEQNEDGTKKTRLEDGWFTRGTKLLVTGYRRGDQFKVKRYKDSALQHALSLIEDIRDDGVLILKHDRVKV